MPSWTKSPVAVAAWLALLGPLPCAPAETRPAEATLRTLRAAFRQNLLSAVLPEKRIYLGQLRDLEKKRAAARDYAGAIKARDERLALEQELTAYDQELPALAAIASGQSALLPERIRFRTGEARLAGVRLEKDGSIAGWNSPGSAATWKLPALPPGGYEVILTYACPGTEGGNFEVQEGFYFLQGRTAPTGDKPSEKNIGTLRIREGAAALTLAAQGTAKGDFMRLIAIELAPVSR